MAPSQANDEQVQAFLRQVGTGQMDEVRRALASSPSMVNAVGPHPFWGGRPQPLHVAIETQRRDMFDLLLEAGADVNGTNDRYDRWSPLMLASDRGRADMWDELIRRGARVGLVEALLSADDTRVDSLLRPGAAALPAAVPNGGSLLNFARTTFAIDRLIALGVQTDVKDRWGTTPIASMSRLGRRGQPLVRHLIAHGAQAGPVEYARLDDREALAGLIASDPAIVASPVVLMAAVDLGHHALTEWLLAQGADANSRAPDQSRQTALHAAAWNGDLPMATLLVRAGADIAARDEEHETTPRVFAETAREMTNRASCQEVADYLARLEEAAPRTSD